MSRINEQIGQSQALWNIQVTKAFNNLFVTPAPAHDNSTGQPNQFSYDLNYIYFCIAPNTWKRIAWASGSW